METGERREGDELEATSVAAGPRGNLAPRPTGAHLADSVVANPPPSRDFITVVLADDHRVFTEGVAMLLQASSGIRVEGIGTTVQELIEIVNLVQPQVSIIDYELPDGNGVDAIAAIHACSPGTKVILLSAYENDSYVVKALEVGCAGYLSKRTAADTVVNAVRSVAAGELLVEPHLLTSVIANAVIRRNQSSEQLSPREDDVLRLLATGATTSEIAQELMVSAHTVRSHIKHLLNKLGAHSRLEAISIALREGYLKHPLY
jgi:DNA-binding NarL/FixJ family response regulator